MTNKEYEYSLTTIEEAVSKIESGDTVWLGSMLSISSPFLDKLADRYEELENVTLIGNTFINPSKLLLEPKYKQSFHVVSFCRKALPKGTIKCSENIDFVIKPEGAYIKTICEDFKINTIAIEMCPPDSRGRCNLGSCGTSITPIVLRYPDIKKRIGIINKMQPNAYGSYEETTIPISYFDYVCESTHSILSRDASEHFRQISPFVLM